MAGAAAPQTQPSARSPIQAPTTRQRAPPSMHAWQLPQPQQPPHLQQVDFPAAASAPTPLTQPQQRQPLTAGAVPSMSPLGSVGAVPQVNGSGAMPGAVLIYVPGSAAALNAQQSQTPHPRSSSVPSASGAVGTPTSSSPCPAWAAPLTPSTNPPRLSWTSRSSASLGLGLRPLGPAMATLSRGGCAARASGELPGDAGGSIFVGGCSGFGSAGGHGVIAGGYAEGIQLGAAAASSSSHGARTSPRRPLPAASATPSPAGNFRWTLGGSRVSNPLLIGRGAASSLQQHQHLSHLAVGAGGGAAASTPAAEARTALTPVGASADDPVAAAAASACAGASASPAASAGVSGAASPALEGLATNRGTRYLLNGYRASQAFLAIAPRGSCGSGSGGSMMLPVARSPGPAARTRAWGSMALPVGSAGTARAPPSGNSAVPDVATSVQAASSPGGDINAKAVVEVLSVELSSDRWQEASVLGSVFPSLFVQLRLGSEVAPVTSSSRGADSATWDPPDAREFHWDGREKWLWLAVFEEDLLQGARLTAEGRLNLWSGGAVGDGAVEVGVYLYVPSPDGPDGSSTRRGPRRPGTARRGAGEEDAGFAWKGGGAHAADGKTADAAALAAADAEGAEFGGRCCGTACVRLTLVEA
eukprot:TRINITY_DN17548_c0_g1_i1.p1 TRINITY_DN17548_c0_g1~~TRINITY_DN17548_c0_g1_i1.p1  ORF type:complete len:691 (-),score=145.43 TRINITY_DN17548_c0_g1_i1:67-2001(-)